MELNIGMKIAELRKAKGMTQEQLASALGISAPAVSKWETENSYPDITMLCPLARVLGTNVDTLLEYEEILSEEKVMAYASEIIELEKNQGVLLADEKLQKLLRQYPNSIHLKFHAATLLTIFQIKHTDCLEVQLSKWEHQKKALLEAVYESKEPLYMHHAISSLAALAMQNNEFEKAEKLLKELPENIGDITHLWVQLYLKLGNDDKALELLQKKLFSLVHQVLACLSLMIEKLQPDNDKALEMCEIYKKMEEIFGVGKSADIVYALIYNRAGCEEKAVRSVVQYLQSCMEEVTVPNPLLFSPSIQPPQYGKGMAEEMILRGILSDESLSEIRENEEVKSLIRKLGFDE